VESRSCWFWRQFSTSVLEPQRTISSPASTTHPESTSPAARNDGGDRCRASAETPREDVTEPKGGIHEPQDHRLIRSTTAASVRAASFIPSTSAMPAAPLTPSTTTMERQDRDGAQARHADQVAVRGLRRRLRSGDPRLKGKNWSAGSPHNHAQHELRWRY